LILLVLQKAVDRSVDAYEIDDAEDPRARSGHWKPACEISPPDDVVHLAVESMDDVSAVGSSDRSPNAGMGKS